MWWQRNNNPNITSVCSTQLKMASRWYISQDFVYKPTSLLYYIIFFIDRIQKFFRIQIFLNFWSLFYDESLYSQGIHFSMVYYYWRIGLYKLTRTSKSWLAWPLQNSIANAIWLVSHGNHDFSCLDHLVVIVNNTLA